MMYHYDSDSENRLVPYEQKRKNPVWLKLICVGLAGVLTGSVLAVGAMESKNRALLTEAQAQIDLLRTELAQAAQIREDALADALRETALGTTLPQTDAVEPVVAIANACQPSVVGVTTLVDQSKLYSNYGSYNDFYSFFFGFGQQRQPQQEQQPSEPVYVEYSFGSGVVLSSDGYIVTNHHVIEGADQLRITFSDGSEADAVLVGSDEYSDIAVLKLTQDKADLVPAQVGDSDAVSVGEMVVAIGNPLGVELLGTLTMGVVSATNREIDLADGRSMDTIQTDAAINSGNSGGGLFNADGQLIGITTLKMSSGMSASASVEGLGFAIPINEALDIIDSLKATGKVERPTLGINAANFTEEYARMYNLEAGIYVSEVLEGTPAQAAGLERMDIITHYNGTRITTKEELHNMLNKTAFGDTVTLTVIRDAQTIEIDVIFTEPAQPVL